ncbi:MAG: hypothetical protein ACRC2T_10970 [Thermoguttaceae bacterium]
MIKNTISRREFIVHTCAVAGSVANVMSLSTLDPNTVSASESQEKNTAEKKAKLVQVLDDPKFSKGFVISGPEHSSPKKIETFDQKNVKPAWGMPRWNSRGNFDSREITDSLVKLSDPYGSVTLERESGAIELVVNASKEYDKPRTSGAVPWTHLLLEQSPFSNPIILKDIKRVWAVLDFELTKFIEYGKNDPTWHAAQFSWFIYLINGNKESKGFGDFLWFGLSFFDNRYDFVPLYANQDFAMPDGKFIYTLSSKSYLDEKVTVGKRFYVKYDILPHIEEGMKTAQERGFLTHSSFRDMSLNGMNIGWEVPGTFDVGVKIYKMLTEAETDYS